MFNNLVWPDPNGKSGLTRLGAIKSQFGGADICINNAGLGHYATLLSGSSAMWREMFEVYNKYTGSTHIYIL